MSNFDVVLFISIILPLFISTMFILYWTRKAESLGVSIPDDVYALPVLRSMRRKYLGVTGGARIATLLVFILFNLLFVHSENRFSLLLSFIIALSTVGGFIIYLIFHQKMMFLKEKNE